MVKPRSPDPERLQIAKSTLNFPVIGVGASAGGISAFQRLLSLAPERIGMSFVIVMHLSPDHESSLPAILQNVTRLTVKAVAETTPLEADHVYVVSPSFKLVMSDGYLRVSKLNTLEGRRQSIDYFFRSLAQAHQERAVCLVLTGTGSDGSQGLKRIKEMGGVAIAQSPEDAEFDGMPLAAIQTGQVDFTLRIDEVMDKLQSLWANARQIELPAPPEDLEVKQAFAAKEVTAEEALLSIQDLLHRRTGHDFAHYKRATVLRRLERRLQVNGLPDLQSYRALLDTKPGETQALLQDMLISVTNFYRDPESFTALEQTVKKAVNQRQGKLPFRAWIAGCATGEEAYSVAILLRELLEASGTPLQLFASDIDQHAIAAARAGLFPASIENDVSTRRLRDFFVTEPSGYRITKAVRDAVIFSTHNVLSDPPFTRMDLICCRNLLIYLDRAAQAQVLKTFHFALKPKGLLFLGGSETADSATELYESVNKAHRLYAAKVTAGRALGLSPTPMRLIPVPLPAAVRGVGAEPEKPPLAALHERVLGRFAPSTVLVDSDLTVLHVSERAGHLLRLPEGAPTHHLLALARPELRVELRATIAKALESGQAVEAPRVRLVVNGSPRLLIMTARPVADEAAPGLILLVFNEVQDSLDILGADAPARDPLVDMLENELLKTQDRLRNTVGESASSNEELWAANEELQTINEELRSTSEELELSREELQALNEELTTVNSELTLRMEETGKINDDLQNLMISVEISTIFVDRDMRLKRYTPQAATLFNLRASDTGRPLMDITHRLDYPLLAKDVLDVLRDLKRVEREVFSDDGRWFLARAVPYRTVEDRIEGAVLAFFDITSRRAAEDLLKARDRQMQLVAERMRDYAIITMNHEGVIESWSPGAELMFGYTPQEAIGKSFEMLFTSEDRRAGVARQELAKARQFGRAEDDRWHRRKSGKKIFVSGITSPLGDSDQFGFAKIARDSTAYELRDQRREADLTAERVTSSRLQELSSLRDEFLAVVSHELKNPLSLIRMNTQLLERLPAVASDPRAARAAQSIQTAVTSQSHLINDLLELSRANLRKMVLSKKAFDLDELVRQVAQAIELDVQAKQQTLRCTLAPVRILADPVRVEQVVWNLMTNAVKFTPVGGAIEVAIHPDGEFARLRVQDSGIGLDPEDLDNIFGMFQQVETGTSRRTNGLGIGLALVKQLTELHGGRVTVTSAGLGHGSTFSVWLPVSHNDADRVSAPAALEGLHGLAILLIDDEANLLETFAEVMSHGGAKITQASTAEQGLELASHHRFDAIVCDLAMPIHDGFWFARRLRMSGSNVPLIAVSGMARPVDRERALQAGFDRHLPKPLELSTLVDVLAELLPPWIDEPSTNA